MIVFTMQALADTVYDAEKGPGARQTGGSPAPKENVD